MVNSVPEAFVFMKVVHQLGMSPEDILKQKQVELGRVGETFWGYGPGPLHPTGQVRPFAREWGKRQGSIHVLMETTNTKFDSDNPPASEYSLSDKEDWKRQSLPAGILVTGKYALVLDEIRQLDQPFDLDLRQYKVGIGDKKGTNATQYLAFQGMKQITGLKKGQGKGCLVKIEQTYYGPDAPKAVVPITYQARLKYPYAVFLR
ncbi:MAG: hypothetical protein F4W93_05730 [Dehalococcoidia bacterium]|nr:hypothetical protein [Dehalococcoidia bacterium]